MVHIANPSASMELKCTAFAGNTAETKGKDPNEAESLQSFVLAQ